METISLVLNGSKVSGRPGATILEVARDQEIDIPTLCYHPQLSPIGACRLCVVEAEGSRTLVASCHTPITPGMVIHTHSPKVLEARQIIMELLLARHPNCCIVCSSANVCELRAFASNYDVGLPRFRLTSRYYPMEDVSPYIRRDLTKCILCRRCVDACRDIKKANVYAISYRGSQSKVTVDCDQPLNKEVCRDCDVCVTVCPTGALTFSDKTRAKKRETPLILKG